MVLAADIVWYGGIMEDKSGNIWIGTTTWGGSVGGTGGLCKFDGTNWTVYNTSNSGIPENDIACSLMDSKGNIWMGHGWTDYPEHGVTKFDGKNWINYNTSNSGIASNVILNIFEDKSGNIWFGSGDDNGASKFDGKNWSTYNTVNSGLINNTINSISEDSKGNIWFATTDGISVHICNVAPQIRDTIFTIAENSPVGTTVGKVSVTDLNAGDTLTFNITSGNVGGMFAMDATGKLSLAKVPDYETDSLYNLLVRVTDKGGLSDSAKIKVGILNVNEPPVIANSNFSIAENSPVGSVVGTLTATDPDAGDVLTYSISSGNGSGMFAIDGPTGKITLAKIPDYETTPLYNLTVKVTDKGGLSATAIDSVKITNVNEPPVIANSNFSIAENSPVGSVVGTLTATDPDAGDVLTYSISSGNGSGMFAIDSPTGKITLAKIPDYETNPLYNLTIKVTDKGGLSATAIDSVKITNVNEPPVIANSNFSIAENSPVGSVVGTLTATDPDAGDVLTYSISSGNGSGMFAIDGPTGKITLAKIPDYETTPLYNLTVKVTDKGGLSATAIDSVKITNVNEPPVIANSNFSIAENSPVGSVVGTLTATDPDAGDVLTYSISSGNGSGMFAIDGPTGKITLAKIPDYETTPLYNLTVKVTDKGGLSATANDSIKIINVNEPPVAYDASFSVDENTAVGYILGIVPATDPDKGDVLKYRIVSGNIGGVFSVDSVSGELTIAKSPDYETIPEFNLAIAVFDKALLSDTANITVDINDINESPVLKDTLLRINENSAIGTVVGTLNGYDPDKGQSVIYSIISGNIKNVFFLNPKTGVIKVNGNLDYETISSYSLSVVVTDPFGLTATANVTIMINNVNEPPVASNVTFSLLESAGIGSYVGTFIASDPDSGQSLTFSIVSENPGNAFSVDSAGNISVSAALSYNLVPKYTLTISVADNGNPPLSTTATVTIILMQVVSTKIVADFDDVIENETLDVNFINKSSPSVTNWY